MREYVAVIREYVGSERPDGEVACRTLPVLQPKPAWASPS
jgi:hypothetical protein